MRPLAMPMSMSSSDCRSDSRALRMMRSIAFPACKGLAGGFDADVGGLYNRPPLLDLGLMIRAERFRRLPLWRWDHLTQILKPAADVLVRECVHGRVCESLDNVFWRTFRFPQAVPR